MKKVLLTMALMTVFSFTAFAQHCPEDSIRITSVCDSVGSCWTVAQETGTFPFVEFTKPTEEEAWIIRRELNSACASLGPAPTRISLN